MGAHSFDFTGEVEKVYALLSDAALAVNARFGLAYTTGLAVDPDTLVVAPMRPQGTVWPRTSSS